MRKWILLLFITFLCFSCCSIEKDAVNQMKKTILEYAKNPDTFKISNIEIVYKSPTDSLVVLSFISKGQNGFGGYSSSYYEYYYIINESGSRYENLIDLDDKNAVSFTKLTNGGLFFEDLPDSLFDKTVRGVIGIRTIINGREIKY